jgi:hypothetical protein
MTRLHKNVLLLANFDAGAAPLAAPRATPFAAPRATPFAAPPGTAAEHNGRSAPQQGTTPGLSAAHNGVHAMDANEGAALAAAAAATSPPATSPPRSRRVDLYLFGALPLSSAGAAAHADRDSRGVTLASDRGSSSGSSMDGDAEDDLDLEASLDSSLALQFSRLALEAQDRAARHSTGLQQPSGVGRLCTFTWRLGEVGEVGC